MKEAFEKILERLEEEKAHQTFCDKEVGYNKGIRKAISIVQKVSEEYNNCWIPCSERLPEHNGVYFVTLDDDVMPRCIDVRNFRNGKFEQRFIVSPLQDKCLERREVAWMPLPEPYKGE